MDQAIPTKWQESEDARKPPGAWNEGEDTGMAVQASKKRKLDSPLDDVYAIIADHFPMYVIRPLVEGEEWEYGELSDLAPSVLLSLRQSMDRFRACTGKKPCTLTPTKPPTNCFELWIQYTSSSHSWTQICPGQYTCRTCFNMRRACFRWHESEKV